MIIFIMINVIMIIMISMIIIMINYYQIVIISHCDNNHMYDNIHND